MADRSYDHIPYPTLPMAQTHPDRLASVATLFGMTPAPIAACRVLEVGCGSGGNLIPMAYFLPGSRFTGIDLAEAPIAEGRRATGELALTNLHLIAMDLCHFGPEMGEFDYIIAHGLYSWIPDDIRDRFLALCRDRLAPHGVALISYNALPGRHVRMMMREMMMYHTRNCADDRQRIEQARDMLRMVGDAQLASPAWRPMVDEEIKRMRADDPGWFFHDDLAPVNDAFYVRDFLARAARHSLQYLGDAEMHLMFDIKNTLDWLGDDVIEREQYLDFLYFRRFRHTLLCRAEVALERPVGPKQMDRFLFSSRARQSEAQIPGLNSAGVSAPDAAAGVAAAMGDVYPLPVPFDTLLKCAGDRETLRAILFSMVCSGAGKMHVHDFASGVSVTPRPQSGRLARWEAARTGVVTYSKHSVLKLDGIVRALIELLDGTRDFDGLVAALAQVAGAPPREEIQARLPGILKHMAGTGLLAGERRG